MHTESFTKGTVVWLSQRRMRRMLNRFCFDHGLGIFSAYKAKKKNVVSGNVDSCINRNYVVTDYVLFESVKYVSQCDLILDQKFLRV